MNLIYHKTLTAIIPLLTMGMVAGQNASDAEKGEYHVKITQQDENGNEQTFEGTYDSEEAMRSDLQLQGFLQDNDMDIDLFGDGSQVFFMPDMFRNFFMMGDSAQSFHFMTGDTLFQGGMDPAALMQHFQEAQEGMQWQDEGGNQFFFPMNPAAPEVTGKAIAINEDVSVFGKKGVVKGNDELKLSNLEFLPLSNGSLLLQFDQSQESELTISIYNKDGRSVFSEYFEKIQGSFEEILDLHQQRPGDYLLEIDTGTRRLTRKLTISE